MKTEKLKLLDTVAMEDLRSRESLNVIELMAGGVISLGFCATKPGKGKSLNFI